MEMEKKDYLKPEAWVIPIQTSNLICYSPDDPEPGGGGANEYNGDWSEDLNSDNAASSAKSLWQ